MSDLKMLTTEEVAELTGSRRENVSMWREIGIIQAIKTGKGYMYSQEEIKRFQRDYMGFDVSNRVKAIEAYNQLNVAIRL
ncbi:MAG: helix-turn-helix domain-containing protein [Erysipelotrichaceae bacterium]|nr:helix-turn-helix domain-containing protein [Erysipelotrichaceae bacterium]